MGIYLIHPFVLVVLNWMSFNYLWKSYFIIFAYILTLFICIMVNKFILLLPKSDFIILVGKGKAKSEVVLPKSKYVFSKTVIKKDDI